MLRFPRHLGHALCLVLTIAAVQPAAAQRLERDQAAHVRYLALNVAIGTTASIARAVVSGRPLRTALVNGLFGGSLMGTGMELVGTESPPARFAGLQLTAVGASVARNAANGTPILSDIT